MKIILTNNVEVNPLVVTGARRYTQGASRDSLTFVFPASEEMTVLDVLFNNENCENITIKTDDGKTFIHNGYTVRAELVKCPVQIKAATEETEAVYEDRIMVTMAQRTEQENKTAEMYAAMNALLKGE